MNRKERRQAQKNLKMGEKINNAPMNVLAPSTPINTLITRQIDKVMDQERLKASNDTLNLIVSILTIVLKELQDFSTERIEEVLKQMIEQMDLCGQQLVTTDEMMALAESYGIKTYIDDDAMGEIGRKIHRKMAAFELLDAGIVEIEELANKANIPSREASAFRWEYNTKKYGVVDMTKKEQVFKYLEEGLSKEEVMKNALITSASYDQYKYLWKRENKTVTPDDLADALFADGLSGKKDKPQEENEASVKQLQGEKEKTSTDSINSQIERAEKNNQSEEKIQEVNSVEEKKVFVPTSKKKELKVRRTVEVEGEFDTYKIENNVVEFGDKAFTKDQFIELIEELQIVAEQF